MLPCSNCGNDLEIFKGTTIQCFTCGQKNSHYESYEVFSAYVQDVFGYPKAIETAEKEVNTQELYRRIEIVDSLYNKYLQQISSLDTFVVSKLYPHSTKSLLGKSISISKNLGMLKILIELYILPHIKGESNERRYKEYCAICEIYHLAILGLRHTIEGKDNFKIEISAEFYERAKWNFNDALKAAERISDSELSLNLEKEILVFDICYQFCSILKDILTINPTIYSDQLEILIEKCDVIPSSKLRVIKSEIKKIYDYSNALPKILEEVRTQKPLKRIDPNREHILYHSEEVIEQLSNAKLWIKDIEENYSTTQNEILKLHGGVFLDYLKVFRNEFQKRVKDAKSNYDKLIDKIIQTILQDYALSASDFLDELERGFQFLDTSPEDIINRARLVKEDLLSLDSEIKQFIFAILDFCFNEDLKKKAIPSMITSISERHSSYDKILYQYLKKIIDKFILERDEKRYTIDEQRDLFNKNVRPLIDNLIQTSFTLTSDQIPYPMFIEIVMMTTTLEIEKKYKVYFIVENPSQIEIKDIYVTFFVPNCFIISPARYKIKRLKPSQRLRLETTIIPEKVGVYYFMAMLQYEYSYEMFWMPTIKQKVQVVESSDTETKYDEDEFLNYIYKKYGKIEQEDSENIVETPYIDNTEEITSSKIGKEELSNSKKKFDDDLLPEI
ncbi:MAG: hypothetical protein ACTSRZ_01485 [Promethearchaeota archaeon]